ncbi:MAG: hypothetical protein IJJ00_07205 [Erysipelotrichaceae bacterium]|nr:hypothetical protein [Erysipelotrichaceae bacterium]
MNRVDLKYECLWGNYEIAAEYDEKEVRYKVDSDIEGIENKEGQKPADEFLKLIDAAAMEKWDSTYEADGSAIEDALHWESEYVRDGRTYRSEGEEGFWPYGYEELIKALSLLDEDLGRF